MNYAYVARIYACVRVRARMPVRVCVCVYVCMCTCVWMRVCACLCRPTWNHRAPAGPQPPAASQPVNSHIHIDIICIYICIYVIYLCRKIWRQQVRNLCICIYICYIYIYLKYIYTLYIHIIYIYICVYIYTYIYIYIYIYINIRRQQLCNLCIRINTYMLFIYMYVWLSAVCRFTIYVFVYDIYIHVCIYINISHQQLRNPCIHKCILHTCVSYMYIYKYQPSAASQPVYS